MFTAILIAASFFCGFFVESIIGFGGGLIAYAILGFFIDLKDMILAGLYIGTCSSVYIFLSDRKNFDKKIFSSLLLISIPATIIGVLFFTKFSSQFLAFFLGILLIALACKTIFFDNFVFPKILKNKLIFFGGFSQGAFGIGGPFVVNALKNDFKSKSVLRATMASFFVFFNLIRIFQLAIQGKISIDFFSNIWWTIIPVFLAIKLGHFVHLKISEAAFKKGIGIMTIFAGINFLFKAF